MQKYGTNEDLKRLHDEYPLCEDNDIFLEYVKLINKLGKDYDDFYNIRILVSETDRGKYDDAIMEEAIKGVKKYLVDEAPKGHWTNESFLGYKEFEYYAQRAKEQGKPEMEANARAIMARIVEDNPWMQGKIDRLRNENKS